MKKVSIVVLDKDRRAATKTLRHLGVVHLEELHGKGADLAAIQGQFEKTAAAAALLSEFNLGKGDFLVNMNITDEQLFSKVDEALALADRKKVCQDRIAANNSELERFKNWGDMDPADFAELAKKGIFLSLYELPSALYFDLPESIKTIQVAADKTACRFLLVGETDTSRPADLPQEAVSVSLPHTATTVLKQEAAALSAKISEIQKNLDELAALVPEIKNLHRRIAKDLEFENVASGFNREEGVRPLPPEPPSPSSNQVDGAELAWLTGFVPADEAQAIVLTAKREHWGVSVSDPDEEDAVPTKLKNNALVSLIYPLTSFLETVPGYREYDISGWFLLFFCVFFGMIFGDAGYGFILAIIALIGMAKTSARGVPAALKMMLLLAISNITWGALTCTWFGVAPDKLPAFFRAVDLDLISGANPDQDFVSENLRVVCFSLALIQLCVAHLKVMGRLIKIPGARLKALGDLGSIAMLLGMYNLVLFLVVNSARFPFFMPASLYIIIGGMLLGFIFSNYEGNIFKSILESFKNIITVILGVANVFGDIMSYIRLWAVGLAGASISSTVNAMAGPLLGNFLMFLGVILLVFGHGLNLVLNILSVLVHGVRLNTLEFSGHMGVSWSGFAYKPFSEGTK